MIATGTDIKPVEIVFFMRNVRSRGFFEQMKGRGVRTISPTDFNAVTPDAPNKDRFVIVDAVGVTENELSDSYSLERNPTISFEKLLDRVSMGDRDPDTLSSLASRLARLDRQLTPRDRQTIEAAAGGASLHDLVSDLVAATDPDAAVEAARQATGEPEPSPEAVDRAERQLLEEAARPFAGNPELRQTLVDVRRSYEQTIDTVSADSLIDAGFSSEQAGVLVQSFQEFIEENRDEITALQVLYERPYRQRLSYRDIKELADALEAPPRSWTTDRLWDAYRRLDESRVRGSGQRVLADVVSLVRHAIGATGELCAIRRPGTRTLPGLAGHAADRRPRTSPPSSAAGWKTSATTSPAASAWTSATSSTPPSTSKAASPAPMTCSGKTYSQSSKS